MSRLSQFIWIILSTHLMAACAGFPVSINSDPPAAMVFLNGEKLGRAPVKTNLDRTKIQEAGTILVPVKVVWASGARFEGHLRLKSSLSQATFNVARPDVGGRYDDELFALKYQELQAQKAAVAAANSRRMMEAGLALMGGGAYSNSGSRDTSIPVGASRLPQGAYTLPTLPQPSAGYNAGTYQAVPQGAYTLPGEFCAGFTEGYKSIKGDMVIVPICPMAPITPIGSTDFREGVKAGIKAASRG